MLKRLVSTLPVCVLLMAKEKKTYPDMLCGLQYTEQHFSSQNSSVNLLKCSEKQ